MMLGLSPLSWREIPLWRLLRTRLLEAHESVRPGDLWDFDLTLYQDRLQEEVVWGAPYPHLPVDDERFGLLAWELEKWQCPRPI